VEPVGSGHFRVALSDPLGGARLSAIAFRVGDGPLGQFLAAARGRAIHVAGHLRRDNYRGGDAVQLIIEDAAAAASALHSIGVP
jgi:single-stranded-DNA-specific exonuclease